MDRKTFLATSCTGVCSLFGSGLLLSTLLNSCKTPLSVVKTTSEKGLVKLPLEAFATDNFKLVRVRNYNYDLAVRKKADGSFLVLVLKCTHANQPLTKTGDKYYCTMHGSQFSPEGKVLKGPAENSLSTLNNAIAGTDLVIKLDHTL
jgi:Rieske Fe-S protein